jgi:hypothetical protein
VLDDDTALLGLDPTLFHFSARGRLSPEQLEEAQALLSAPAHPYKRLIVACHYPVVAPTRYQRELFHKRLENDRAFREWLSGIGPHLYCCGHVHAAWAFRPSSLLNQICLNAGAPLMRDPTGLRPPGFLEIDLEDDTVRVAHHAWDGTQWRIDQILQTVSLSTEEAPAAAG